MALKHNSGKTWYELTAGKPPATEKLKKDVTCDVCVVGGGLTGVVAALRLAEAGKQVVLLDAGQIGDGASGRSGAPLLAGINEPLTAVIDIIGESAAEELWRHTINGRQALLNRIKKHNIDCDFTEGVIYVARTEKQKRQLEHKADFHDRRFGKEYLEFMDTAEVNEAVRSPLYVAGAKAKRAGHFHPLKFLYGLAEAAKEAGVQIYENTRVSDIRLDVEPKAVTELGMVTAKHMLICGNAYMDHLMPPDKTKTVTMPQCQFVSEPLDPDLAHELLPNREAVIDLHYMPVYHQIMPDNRLVMGGPDEYVYHSADAVVQKTLKRLHTIYPQLPEIKAEHLWRGPVGVTMNFVPVFEQPDENVYMVHGFNGHGLVMSYTGGVLVAEAVLGNTDGFELFSRLHQTHMPQVLHHFLARVGLAYYRLKDMMTPG